MAKKTLDDVNKNRKELAKDTDGAKCSPVEICLGALCCGTSTPLDEGLKSIEAICIDKNKMKYTDFIGNEYKHAC